MRCLMLIFSLLLITGCATGYQKYGFAGGYKDKMLDDGTIELGYYGNGTTSYQAVQDFWAKRAHELCPNGFDVVQKEAGANKVQYPITVTHPKIEGVIKCR